MMVQFHPSPLAVRCDEAQYGSRFAEPERKMSMLKLKIGAVVTAFILLTAGIGGAMAWSPVDEGSVDVVTEWGDATGEVNTPGANWITPVKQDTVSLSTRQQAYTMTSKQRERERKVMLTP